MVDTLRDEYQEAKETIACLEGDLCRAKQDNSRSKTELSDLEIIYNDLKHEHNNLSNSFKKQSQECDHLKATCHQITEEKESLLKSNLEFENLIQLSMQAQQLAQTELETVSTDLSKALQNVHRLEQENATLTRQTDEKINHLENQLEQAHLLYQEKTFQMESLQTTSIDSLSNLLTEFTIEFAQKSLILETLESNIQVIQDKEYATARKVELMSHQVEILSLEASGLKTQLQDCQRNLDSANRQVQQWRMENQVLDRENQGLYSRLSLLADKEAKLSHDSQVSNFDIGQV